MSFLLCAHYSVSRFYDDVEWHSCNCFQPNDKNNFNWSSVDATPIMTASKMRPFVYNINRLRCLQKSLLNIFSFEVSTLLCVHFLFGIFS